MSVKVRERASVITVLAALACAGPAWAALDPSDATVAVPQIRYQSPLHDYRPLGDSKRIPWKAANDEVRRIGGWRAYAKEASEAATPAKPASPAEAAKSPPTQTAPPTPTSGHTHDGQPGSER